jgi:hypothetical protein
MAMGAAWKLRRVVGNVRNVLAIELMCAAQGLDYRAPLRAGRGAAEGHRRVRTLVEPLAEDRVLSSDIIALASAIERGHFATRTATSLRPSPLPRVQARASCARRAAVRSPARVGSRKPRCAC